MFCTVYSPVAKVLPCHSHRFLPVLLSSCDVCMAVASAWPHGHCPAVESPANTDPALQESTASGPQMAPTLAKYWWSHSPNLSLKPYHGCQGLNSSQKRSLQLIVWGSLHLYRQWEGYATIHIRHIPSFSLVLHRIKARASATNKQSLSKNGLQTDQSQQSSCGAMPRIVCSALRRATVKLGSWYSSRPFRRTEDERRHKRQIERN